jgi:hypothetical protein
MRRHPILALSGIGTLVLLAAVFAVIRDDAGPAANAETFGDAGLGLIQVATVHRSPIRYSSGRETAIDFPSIDDFDLNSVDDTAATACMSNAGQ